MADGGLQNRSGPCYSVSSFRCRDIRGALNPGSGRDREQTSGGELGSFPVQFTGGLLAEPRMAVLCIVAGAGLILLEESGEIHGTQFPEQDGFRFLIERSRESHDREVN